MDLTKFYRRTFYAAAFLLSLGVGWAHAANGLFEVARSGSAPEMEKILSANKSLVNLRTELGSTALHLAATNPDPEVARVLIAKGANVNARDNNDSTPLHIAAYTGRKKLVELLLASGADAHARDFKGETPKDKAEISLSHELQGILAIWMLKHPAQPAKSK